MLHMLLLLSEEYRLDEPAQLLPAQTDALSQVRD